MNHQIVKIYNEDDFKRITNGIKVAQCMRVKSATVPDSEKVVFQLDDLVVSNSLSCSFCNTAFENKAQQRLHYKLDWHRYNLKQRLKQLESVSEDAFSLLAEKDDISSISGSESDSENEDDIVGSIETSDSPNRSAKSSSSGSKNSSNHNSLKNKKLEKKTNSVDLVSDNEEAKKREALLSLASRHSKVFFENKDGNIFSIYRCLLHSKKDIPEIDNEMVSQALDSGKKSLWTIIMVGGGHFAAAVFSEGKAIAHKTFHSYTVRAKQGSSQNSRDNRNGRSHPKSAGASLRRYNENSLLQHIQDILESWSAHLANSSLILFRAVGPRNRTILFGGKNPPLDKNDNRLRPLPFPTCRATFNEVKRVYDILSNMEIYGSATSYANCFPISPRQPLRKKVVKSISLDDSFENADGDANKLTLNTSKDSEDCNEKKKTATPERHNRSNRTPIDRAKPRKSPHRPLPDIVAQLARSSSESDIQDYSAPEIIHNFNICVEDYETEFTDNLKEFDCKIPRFPKNKKIRQQKRKIKKDRTPVNEILESMKPKLWNACQTGDEELYSSSIERLLAEINRCKELQKNVNVSEEEKCDKAILIGNEDLLKAINGQDEDGNTMLHLAANNNQLKIIWSLLDLGCDPCNKNKKLQTPYVVSNDKQTRSIFRKFMAEFSDKYNYNKSQIPGPLTEEIEQKELEKKKEQKKAKKEREKLKKKKFELKKQEEKEKQEFLNLSDREKRALAAEKRMQQGMNACIRRCFQCGLDLGNTPSFEYNENHFCSMPCLKEHKLHTKFNH